jgi:uncharacterized protein
MVQGRGARRIQLRCPICRKPVARADEEFPFCSTRCRTIDLGRWASGAYVIPSPIEDTEKEDAVSDAGLLRDNDDPDND